jgi:lysophospholipase L1-like esterase
MAWVPCLLLTGFVGGTYAGLFKTFPVPQIIAAKQTFDRLRVGGRALYVNEDAVTMARKDEWLTGKAEIVMAGDSITAGGRWNEFFSGIDIHNRGIGSDTVSGLFARVPHIIAKKPERVFILIGITDIFRGSVNADIAAKYGDVVEALVPHTKVYLQSVIHCGPPLCDEDRNVQIVELNKQIAAIAKTHGAGFIDLNAALSANQQIKPEFTDDGVHLTPTGYRVWRDVLAPYVLGGAVEL